MGKTQQKLSPHWALKQDCFLQSPAPSTPRLPPGTFINCLHESSDLHAIEKRMAGVEGLEPPTLGLEIRCSIRLSYTPSMLQKYYHTANSGQAPTHLGVASGRPPSTGRVAPVVGVWRVAKNITARATSSPVTRDFSRFRCR